MVDQMTNSQNCMLFGKTLNLAYEIPRPKEIVLRPSYRLLRQNFYGSHMRLSILNMDGETILDRYNYFVKFAVHRHLNDEDSKYLSHLFDREIYIFACVLTELDSYLADVPGMDLLMNYHLTYVDSYLEEKEEFYVFREQRAYELSYLDFKHSELFIKFLAKFHALSYMIGIHTHQNPLSTCTGYRAWMANAIFTPSRTLNQIYLTYTALGMEYLSNINGGRQYFDIMNESRAAFLEIMQKHLSEEYSKRFFVIVHGNLNLRSIKFTYDVHGQPVGVMLTEWQMAHVNSPAIDVAMFLSVCVDAQLRETRGDELIAIYETERRLSLLALGASDDAANVYINFPDEARYFYRYGVNLSCVSLLYMSVEEFSRPEFKQKVAQSFIYAIDRGYFSYNI